MNEYQDILNQGEIPENKLKWISLYGLYLLRTERYELNTELAYPMIT